MMEPFRAKSRYQVESEKETMMTTQDRETKVVYSYSSGGAGWFIAILLLIVLGVGGLYLYNSGALDGSSDVNVSIDVPEEIVPAAPAE
ncbi:MAG: hypothetical protein CL534_18455 [Ahrensia sp.]|nr:hypothetical protein [Ahrensia sp.]